MIPELVSERLVEAYKNGFFPMPHEGRIGWFQPDPRGILPLENLIITRSLRRSCERFTTRVDQRFRDVIEACADPSRPHGWIDEDIIDAYCELHQRGIAHSIETYNSDDELCGGLYGVAIGGLFAGESMFHAERDASKVALVTLVELLADGYPRLLDVQWATPHLTSLGAVEVSNAEYLELLAKALGSPLPSSFVNN